MYHVSVDFSKRGREIREYLEGVWFVEKKPTYSRMAFTSRCSSHVDFKTRTKAERFVKFLVTCPFFETGYYKIVVDDFAHNRMFVVEPQQM